jgi:pyridoxine/pyridoxamine 5'-phosphate oxidase
MTDHTASARQIIDSCQYLTLATADAGGRPWASPVWFAHEDHVRFLWVSKPGARHSRNLEARPETGIVIFDSSVPMGAGQAVYVEAAVEQLQGKDERLGIEVFSARSQALGGSVWTLDDLRPPSELRLYRATASAQYVLGPNDERLQVNPGV